MGDLVSVIIPVYNVEKYLNRCVESVTNQTFKNIEIILIDDGSTDSSGKMCDLLKKKDERIKVIHKKNDGLGMARNSGLEVSTGEYVIFIDSDDFIKYDMIEQFILCVQENDVDTVYCSFETYDNSLEKIVSTDVLSNNHIEGYEILLDILGANPQDKEDWKKGMSVWAAMFSKKVIDKYNIKFESEREFMSEDILFDIRYLVNCQGVSTIPYAGYYYCLNSVSLSRSYQFDRVDRLIKLYRKVISEMNLYMSKERYILRYKKLVLGVLRVAIFQEVNCSNNSLAVIIKKIKYIINDSTIREIISDYPYGLNPIKQRIFNFSLDKKLVFILYLLAKLQGQKRFNG